MNGRSERSTVMKCENELTKNIFFSDHDVVNIVVKLKENVLFLQNKPGIKLPGKRSHSANLVGSIHVRYQVNSNTSFPACYCCKQYIIIARYNRHLTF